MTEVRTELGALVSQDFFHLENLKLAKHIFKHLDDLLRFLEDPAVPPTNNLAEQELRAPSSFARSAAATARPSTPSVTPSSPPSPRRLTAEVTPWFPSS